MKEKKKEILSCIVNSNMLSLIDGNSVEEGLQIIKKEIESFKKENKQFKWINFKFDVDGYSGYDGDHIYLQIIAEREITDEEIKERNKRDKEFKERVKQNEIKELNRLLKKYNKKRSS